MRFRITLSADVGIRLAIPINYQYPLSSAIYRIIAKGDRQYADFLHEKGYGKGFKFFTFSDINCPFKIDGDRLLLQQNELSFVVAFHLPEAVQHFVQGLFASENIVIADKKSKVSFRVKAIEALSNLLVTYAESEILARTFAPLSPLVTGLKNEAGNYDYLSPQDADFVSSFIYNWREKIKASYDDATAQSAFLFATVTYNRLPPKSRLITIKADTPEETKIRGFVNFKLEVKAERRFIELLLDTGAGLYTGQGMGCLGIVEE
ncbi:CRISPR-associated endoribonuclease Cas6 [Sphingobacterium sp. MYb382]|uniref:CRISPR-associated endoribonuclease Cas6 n=1 Tax=Sphingobacterium sp. MYb382 TaxID=2745278 RepID=UPI0030ADC69D